MSMGEAIREMMRAKAREGAEDARKCGNCRHWERQGGALPCAAAWGAGVGTCWKASGPHFLRQTKGTASCGGWEAAPARRAAKRPNDDELEAAAEGLAAIMAAGAKDGKEAS